MATDWTKVLSDIQKNKKTTNIQRTPTSTSTNKSKTDWGAVLGQIQMQGRKQSALEKHNSSLKKLSDVENEYRIEADEYYTKWQDPTKGFKTLIAQNKYYRGLSDYEKNLKANEKDYKLVYGEKAYNETLKAVQDALKGETAAKKGLQTTATLYSKFKNEDEFKKARQQYAFDKKYSELNSYEAFENSPLTQEYRIKTLPKNEQDYLRQKKFFLEYKEIYTQLPLMKEQLASLEKSLSNQNSYITNPLQWSVKKEELKSRIDKAEKRLKELNSLGGDYAGIINQIFSSGGELAFDQRWSGAKEDYENYKKEAEEKAKFDKMSGKGEYYTPRPDEMTPEEKNKALSGKKVQRKREDEYALEIDEKFDPKYAGESNYLYYATPEEKELHAFLKKTEGEVVANRYLEELKIAKLDKRLNQAIFDEEYKYGSKSPVLASVGSIGNNLLSGFEFTANALGAMNNPYAPINDKTFHPLYRNLPRSTFASKAQGQREGVKSQIDSDILDFIYDVGMSGADSIAAAGLSKMVPYSGEFLLGGSAAASAYNEALDRGLSGGDAVLTAVTSGIAEGVFEHISIGKILDGGDIIKGFTKTGLKQAAKKVASDVVVNLSEETLTELSNVVADQMINGELSNYAFSVREYMSQGMTEDEARKKAAADIGEQIGLSGLSGALMGAFFGASGSLKGMRNSSIANSRSGSIIKQNGNISELKELAANSGIADIQKAAEDLTDLSKPSKIGYVYNSLVDNAVDNAVRQMTPILLENGATKSGSNSAKGWAKQIANSVFNDNADTRGLAINKVTRDVYSDFVSGKYGGSELVALKDMVTPTPISEAERNQQISDNINNRIAAESQIKRNIKEFPSLTFGTDAFTAETAENVKKMSQAAKQGTIAQAYGQRVAEKLEAERPNKKAIKEQLKKYMPNQSRITAEGEKIVKDWAKTQGLKVKFTDNLVDDLANGKYKNGTLYISRYSINPIKIVIKHEFTHSTENSKLYEDFKYYLFDKDSTAFKEWLNKKGFKTWKEAYNYEYKKFEDAGVIEKYDNPTEVAENEVVANFVSETLFNKDGTDLNDEITLDFLTELNQKDRGLFKRFVDFMRSILKRMTTRGAANRDIIKLEQKFLRLVETARQQRTKGESEQSGGGYSIVKDAKNRDIVVLDRNIFDGITNLKKRAEALENWILKNFGGTKHNTADYFFVVMNERTAGKLPFWNENMNESEYFKKLSAAEHIDELVKISKFYKHSENFKDKHKEFASKGWNYFKSYFTDGEFVYEADISVARSKEQAVVYNIGDIKRKGKYNKKESSYSLTGSPNELATSPKNGAMNRNSSISIPNSSENVKGQYSLPDIEASDNIDYLMSSLESIKEKAVDEHMRKVDERYNEAIKSGDVQVQEKLVAEVAKREGAILDENGEPLKLYRGTKGGQTVFSKGVTYKGKIYTANNVYAASSSIYGDKSGKVTPMYEQIDGEPTTYALYGFPKKMLTMDAASLASNELLIPKELQKYSPDSRKASNAQIAEWAEQEGYDTLCIKNIRDGGSIWSDQYLFFDENLVKSADPVTYDNNGNIIPPSARFNEQKTDIRYSLPEIPDIARGKSNTELEQLIKEGKITLDDAVNSMNDQYGTMPKGENPKVDVDVPNKVSDTKGVRRFARTALESGHLTKGMSEDAKKEILSGALNYQVSSNKSAITYAETKVKTNINDAIQKWEALVKSGRMPKAKEIALGEVLLVEAAKAGNSNDVSMYLAELAAMGTQLGQSVQALSLLKRLSGAGQLHYISRVVAQLNEDLTRRFGNKYQNLLKIDPDLESVLAKSKNQKEIDQVVDRILTDIAKQMPSTWKDKLSAWRYLAMLGNPRTHIRNFFGNGVFMPAIRLKTTLAAVGEKAFIRNKENRTKVFKVKKSYKEFALSDAMEIEDILKSGGKMSPSDIVNDRRKIFTSKLFSWAEGARQANFKALEWEDWIFLRHHYKNALGGVLQARGVDVKNITEAQLQSARKYAILEAQKATYRDASHFANCLNKLAHPTKHENGWDVLTAAGGVMVEAAMPFKKTPINVLKRGIEYSPIGIFTSLANATAAKIRGEFSGAQLINEFSAGLSGTAIMALGMFLQSIGLITGGLGYDDEDALERMSGAQPYALTIGDYSYTIDWMAPSSLPLLIGAEIQKANEEGENLNLFDAVATIGEPMTELSFLQGVNDIIEGASYSGNDGLGWFGEIATNLASSYLSQYVPTVGGQVARTIDDTRRANFIDKNSDMPRSIQKGIEKIKGKIPFVAEDKVPYIDAWGRVEKNDNALLRAFENLASPGYLSKLEDDKVNNELARIFSKTGDRGVIPKKAQNNVTDDSGKTVYLDAKKYVRYAKDKGRYSREYVEDVMSNSMFREMSAESKAEVIKFLFSYADAKAKSNVVDFDYASNDNFKTAAKLEAAGFSVSSVALAKVAMMVKFADADGNDSASKREKRESLKNVGFRQSEVSKIMRTIY